MNSGVSFAAFLHMGGYAWYVWSAYGVGLIVLILNLFITHARLQRTLKKLRRHKG